MNAVQHTPGPWEQCSNLIRTSRTSDGGGYLVAEVPVNTAHTLADARLIATSPELLEALQRLLALVRRNAPELSGKALGNADAAIAKATGATS